MQQSEDLVYKLLAHLNKGTLEDYYNHTPKMIARLFWLQPALAKRFVKLLQTIKAEENTAR